MQRLSLLICLVLLASGFAIAAGRDSATIRNTGSTNSRGYSIVVSSDGFAEVNGIARAALIPASLIRTFFGDLAAARAARAAGTPCLKSASFGSRTVVSWHGWTSPDLECPGDRHVASLASDVRAIAAKAGLSATPRRIPLLRHEPRQLLRPSPSPEPGRPAA